MTLSDAIEHLEEYLGDDVAYAKLDRNEPTGQQLVYFRIADVRIVRKTREWNRDEALLVVESTPMDKGAPAGLSVRQLLATLRQLPAECTSYPLTASGLEIEAKGDEVPLTLNCPIFWIGRDDNRKLCLLIFERTNRAAKPWWKFWART